MTVAAMAVGGVARGQEQPAGMQDMKAGGNAEAKAAVKDVERKRLSAQRESGGRMVSVPEYALMHLSTSPREHFHKAIEQLEQEPGKVTDEIASAADVFVLEAARADGDVRQQMEQCGRKLRALAEKVETRQVLSKDKLQVTFGRALHTLAMFENQQAEMGLAAKDEERVGYGIRQANYDLALALVLCKAEPAPAVSQALYNADTLGEQMLNLATPTTAQLAARSNDAKPADAQTAGDKQEPTGTAKRGAEPLGANQVQQAMMIPKEAPKVIEAMDEALKQTQQQLANVKD